MNYICQSAISVSFLYLPVSLPAYSTAFDSGVLLPVLADRNSDFN